MIFSKKAQVTIFIILAILAVAIVVIFFVVRGVISPGAGGGIETNPQRFIELCAEEEMRNSINLALSQGGFLESENYILYNDTKVSYLCKNNGLFEPCINQHPMLLNEISQELNDNIKPIVNGCFIELKESFKDLGYEVVLGEDKGTEIMLSPGNVFLSINRSVSVSKNEESTSFESMKIPYKTSLYELASVAVDIVKSEANLCYFEYLGYMILYPQYIIKIKVYSDSSKVYSIKDANTKEEMSIAIRGCALG